MDLAVVWYVLVSILFIGFFFLEGFDFGVGVLFGFLPKSELEKRTLMNAIGPFWDGNEVWLITAGGAIFAAFPNWYATMFSGFYLALLVVLAALIFRGAALEFRGKHDSESWKRSWDRTFFISSLVLALLWGVAMANLIKGVPIDGTMNYVGSFFDLLSPYTLAAGLATLLVFTFHGAIFLSLRCTGELEQKTVQLAKKLGLAALILSIILGGLTWLQTDLFDNKLAIIAAVASVVALIGAWQLVGRGKSKAAMLANGASIALATAALFLGMFPRVMVSSLAPEYSLTIYNAASSAKTLLLMTKVALIFVPIVLGYQAWTYWIFRKRIHAKDLEY